MNLADIEIIYDPFLKDRSFHREEWYNKNMNPI